jgi:nucleotide-binding universal stress UspA family protein
MNTPSTLPVIVGVDGLPGSAGALRYGIAEARRRHAPLHLVHVVPSVLALGPGVPMADLLAIGVDVLEKAGGTARELAPDLEVETVLTRGDRATGVVKAAKDAQLVVVGRESRRGVERMLTGTATASIAAHAPCGVVVVPSFWMDSHAHGRVVVGVKSSHNVHELLSQAFSEAAARQASLRLVTAWQLADPYFDRIEARTHAADWEQNGIEALAEVIADWRTAFPEVEVETRVVHGPAARVLLHASDDSDLLLVSRRRLALPPYGKLGGVGHDLLRLSDVPVQLVPYSADPVTDTESLVLEEAGTPLK